jgi:hypothetical protein
VDNALSTEPADRERMTVAMTRLYEIAGYPPPPGVFVRSPITAAIAASIAAGVWWLRGDARHGPRELGLAVTEADLAAAVPVACALAVARGMRRLQDGDWTETPGRDVDSTTGAVLSEAAARAATCVEALAVPMKAIARETATATSEAIQDGPSTEGMYTQVSDQACAALTLSLREALDVATLDATADAIEPLSEATEEILEAVDDTVRLATPNGIFNAVGNPVEGNPSDRLVNFLLSCVPNWWLMHNGGSDWSAWPAYLSFFRHVAGLDLPEYEKWQHHEDAARYGASRMVHHEFWMVSDRHCEIHLDPEGRLHNSTGPARAWADGWALWYWHGTPVPRSLIESDWSVEQIFAATSEEVRRCAIEKMGWPEFIAAAGLRQVGPTQDDPGNPGQTIALYDLPEGFLSDDVRILLCTNGSIEADGTRRRYGLTVPVDVESPLEGQAWMADDPGHPVRVSAKTYAQMARRH